MSPAPLVAVFGSSTIAPGSPAYLEAFDLGRRLALRGAGVITGGYGGAMEACSRGAREAGGRVVGVTVELFERRGPVNRWVEERVHTPDLFERLRHIISRADGFVAVAGSVGTVTEVMLTWTLLSVSARPAAPLVLLGRPWKAWLDAHRHPDLVLPHLFDFVRLADTTEEAARLALDGVAARPPG
ncbi:MAG TPA: LOG family protein [Terriglobales bacterium]|nr:LOG family protein [Terriglobales bacterium]